MTDSTDGGCRAPAARSARALAGSEDWRLAPFGLIVRRPLDQIATLACATAPKSRQARVTPEERRTPKRMTSDDTLPAKASNERDVRRGRNRVSPVRLTDDSRRQGNLAS
jgi:hypothetical protein